jgi:hypothetical protein
MFRKSTLAALGALTLAVGVVGAASPAMADPPWARGERGFRHSGPLRPQGRAHLRRPSLWRLRSLVSRSRLRDGSDGVGGSGVPRPQRRTSGRTARAAGSAPHSVVMVWQYARRTPERFQPVERFWRLNTMRRREGVMRTWRAMDRAPHDGR